MWMLLPFVVCLCGIWPQHADACMAVSRSGNPVVNADQTVLILWDEASRTEHFIRKPSFRGGGESDFGFLVPTPSRPEVTETEDSVFSRLASITAPPAASGGWFPFGCAAAAPQTLAAVRVVERKTVAGMDVAVLQADGGAALAKWLMDHGYAQTPEVADWAKPYLSGDWFITAMKYAKNATAPGAPKTVAGTLSLRFKTDRPLFPYRESDTSQSAAALSAKRRLLRIYFIAGWAYGGRLDDGSAWSGKPVWSDALTPADRTDILRRLGLPAATLPATAWLTEFEDDWKYRKAPADLYFSKAAERRVQRRVAETGVVDPVIAIAAASCVLTPVFRRKRR